MAWVKLDDDFYDHWKFAGLTAAAGWLWIRTLAWCNRHRTGGVVPAVVVTAFAGTEDATLELVGRGLWHQEEDGFRIHDYGHYQPDRLTREDRRQRQAEGGRKAMANRWGKTKADAGQAVSPSNPLITSSNPRPEPELTTTTTPSLRSGVVEKNSRPYEQRAHAVFDYWLPLHPKARFTPDRKRKVVARLKEGFTVEDIHLAIDGARRAPFIDDHGVRRDDLVLICRSASKLEDFQQRANPVTRSGPRPSTSDLLREMEMP